VPQQPAVKGPSFLQELQAGRDGEAIEGTRQILAWLRRFY
jgi:hypothetical protein